MSASVHALSAALATAATTASMAVAMAVPAAAPGLPTARAAAAPTVATAASHTVAADGSYRLAVIRTRDGRAAPVRWEPCQAAVAVRAAVTALPAAVRASALADLREALRRLSRAMGMRFVLVGTTTRVPTGPSWSDQLGDAELVVAWVDQSRSVLRTSLLGQDPDSTVLATGGYAYRTWTAGTGPVGVIGRGFVVVDVAHAAAAVPGFGAGLTRGDLLLHELGHVVGLAHVQDPAQLMYPVIRTRNWSGWRAGDRAGLVRLGRARGCIGAPDSLWPPV